MSRPPEGAERPPQISYCSWSDSQAFAGLRTPAYRLDAYRRGSYRLTPAPPGLWAPAHRDHQAKPRALSGRGAWLDVFDRAQQKQSSVLDPEAGSAGFMVA